MHPPVDHEILDVIDAGLDAMLTSDFKDLVWIREVDRRSECIEFYDSEDDQWYEIVVCPIDHSSAELDAEESEASQ